MNIVRVLSVAAAELVAAVDARADKLTLERANSRHAMGGRGSPCELLSPIRLKLRVGGAVGIGFKGDWAGGVREGMAAPIYSPQRTNSPWTSIHAMRPHEWGTQDDFVGETRKLERIDGALGLQ